MLFHKMMINYKSLKSHASLFDIMKGRVLRGLFLSHKIRSPDLGTPLKGTADFVIYVFLH